MVHERKRVSRDYGQGQIEAFEWADKNWLIKTYI